MKKTAVISVFAAVSIISTLGQGFVNLDFESAQNLPINPGYGELASAANALPGWTAYGADNVLSEVYYASNVVSGTAAPVGLDGGSLALSGNYSAVLYTGGSISQTGLVPSDAESLEFEAWEPGYGGPLGTGELSVTLGDQTLSYSVLSDGPSYVLYGANIPSDLNGQSETLTFIADTLTPGILLDNIEFLPTSVPEPSEFALMGLGAIALLVLRRRRQSVSLLSVLPGVNLPPVSEKGIP